MSLSSSTLPPDLSRTWIFYFCQLHQSFPMASSCEKYSTRQTLLPKSYFPLHRTQCNHSSEKKGDRKIDRLKWNTLPAMLTWMVIPSLLQIRCVCPLRTHVEILTANVIVLKSETFGWGLGHESRVLMNRISTVIKRDPREASPSS